MAKVALIVKTKTLPGKRGEVRRLAEEILGPRAMANPAQELVIFFEDDTDPDLFYLVELYRDRASHQENQHAPWFFEYLQRVQPLVAGMPEVMTGTPQWAKGIAL